MTASAAPRKLPSRYCAVAYLCARLPGMSREEYLDHYTNVHFPLAIRVPGLLKYTQLPVRKSGFRTAESTWSQYDSLSVSIYESEEAYRHAKSTPQGIELEADTVTFMDNSKMAIIPVWCGQEFSSGLQVGRSWTADGY